MSLRKVDDADFAKTVFAMYREHGLGRFANWLTMKEDSLERSEVVDAMRFSDTRKAAEKLMESYRAKIEEMESMLAEPLVCGCGGRVKYFAEALMTSLKCDGCNQFLMGFDNEFRETIYQRWSRGERGVAK